MSDQEQLLYLALHIPYEYLFVFSAVQPMNTNEYRSMAHT